MAGLFSNKYDVEQGINDAMTKTALSYGAIDRSAYAPMTASTALQGDMAGRGIGMMLGGQDPMAAKQSAVDAIMQKYPNPDTPEEMDAIANELGKAGFPDLSLEVRNVGIELKKGVDSANKPSKDLLDQISFGLTSTVLSPQFMDLYMQEFHPKLTVGTEKGQVTQAQYDKKLAAGKTALENQFKAFRNSISRDKSKTVQEVNNILSNETLLIQEFKEWAKTRGDNKMSNFINERVGFSIVGEGESGVKGDGTDLRELGLISDPDKLNFINENVDEFDKILGEGIVAAGGTPWWDKTGITDNLVKEISPNN